MDDRLTGAAGYDDPMCGRMLGIAADVLRSFGSAFGGEHLAIVGGIVPSLLVGSAPDGPAHVGTTDLDLHLSLHLLDGETADYYDAILDGLHRLGLAPALKDKREIRWRWVGRHRDVALCVEFLCPTRTRSGRPEPPATGTIAEKNIGPNNEISALAIGCGHLVPPDTILVPRRVETSRGGITFDFPVSGLTSWLCMKSDAIMLRDKPKDSYDVVWTIAALGPEQAAAMVAGSSLLSGSYADEVRRRLKAMIEDQFVDTDSVGPIAYADFFDARDDVALRRHAHGAVRSFGRAVADG